MAGKFHKPPKAITKDLESYESAEADKKYIEYRKGLFSKLTELGATTLKDENKKKIFYESIMKSNDINTLILDTSIIKKLDTVDGLPKLLLTVYTKWLETFISI